MTDAQKDQQVKVREILDEHFTAWILVFETEGETDGIENHTTCYSGGYSTARGLLDIARDQLRDDIKSSKEDDLT